MPDDGAGLTTNWPWAGVLAGRLPLHLNESFVVLVVTVEQVNPDAGGTSCPLDTWRLPGTTILKPVVGWLNPTVKKIVEPEAENWPVPVPLNGGGSISTNTSKKLDTKSGEAPADSRAFTR